MMRRCVLIWALATLLFPIMGNLQMSAAAEPTTGDKTPAVQAYTIELKYISSAQAVMLLNSTYKAFIPKEISALIAQPNGQKLLFNSSSAQAAIAVSQLVSLLDKPADWSVEMMLILDTEPPQPNVPPSIPGQGNNPTVARDAVYAWARNLLNAGHAGVIILPTQCVQPMVNQSVDVPPLLKWPLTMQLRLFVPPATKSVPGIVAVQAPTIHLAFVPVPPSTAPGAPLPENATGLPARCEIHLQSGQTMLVPVTMPGLLPTDGRLFLAITLKQQPVVPTVALLHPDAEAPPANEEKERRETAR